MLNFVAHTKGCKIDELRNLKTLEFELITTRANVSVLESDAFTTYRYMANEEVCSQKYTRPSMVVYDEFPT